MGRILLLEDDDSVNRGISLMLKKEGHHLFSCYTIKEAETVFRRRKIGFIFQAFNLVSSINVWENIVLPIGLDKQKIDKSFAEDIIKTLGIEKRYIIFPIHYQGGSNKEPQLLGQSLQSRILYLQMNPPEILIQKQVMR